MSCSFQKYIDYQISKKKFNESINYYITNLTICDRHTGKPGTTRHPSKTFFVHLQSCRRPDIELSKFYCRSLSRTHYNRPNRSLPSAWNNTFLRNRSMFSRYLRTPRCAWFSCRRSHIQKEDLGPFIVLLFNLGLIVDKT